MNTQTLKLARQRGDHHTPSHSCNTHTSIFSHTALRVSAQIQNASKETEFLIQVLAFQSADALRPSPTLCKL